MSDFVMLRATLVLTVLLLLTAVIPSNSPSAAKNLFQDESDILGGWTWEWRNNTGFTVSECSGGNGKIIVIVEDGEKKLAFTGKVRNASGVYGDELTKSGTWEYLGQDPNYQNRRKYRFNWGNDKDVVIMSESGNTIVGSNGNGLGKCRVQGRK